MMDHPLLEARCGDDPSLWIVNHELPKPAERKRSRSQPASQLAQPLLGVSGKLGDLRPAALSPGGPTERQTQRVAVKNPLEQ